MVTLNSELKTLEWALSELTIKGQPEQLQLNELSIKLNSQIGLNLYTDNHITAIANNVEIERIDFDEEAFFEHIISGTEYTSCSTVKLFGVHFYLSINSLDPTKLRTIVRFEGFEENGNTYWCTSDNGHELEPDELTPADVFFLASEVKASKKKSQSGKTLSITEKGLALLSLHLAYNNPEYQKAGRVNASKVRDLIVSLASDYKEFSGDNKLNSLNSINNDISSILKSIGLDRKDVGAPYEK